MSVTFILIIITVGISVYAWSNPEFMAKWIFHPVSIAKHNEYYRFITSGFLHADWGHLFFNMFSFYMFASYVEQNFKEVHDKNMGILLFLLVYIGGIIVADIYTFIKEKGNYAYRGLGASGGVSAIIFSSILLNPLNNIYLIFIPIGIPGFLFGVLYLMYCYFQAKRMGDNINHDAHFYGALYGFVLTIFLIPGSLLDFFEQVKGWNGFFN